MNERTRAEEHLRVIRTLMERATIYRAISAPTALVGGLLACCAAAAILWLGRSGPAAAPRVLHPRLFAGIWLCVLLLVLLVNTLFMWREAHKDGRSLISPGARLALRAIAPCLIIPAATTIWFWHRGQLVDELLLVAVWIASYGLALLATALFAPRSLAVLGWAFLLSSLLFFLGADFFGRHRLETHPSVAMGVCFGSYHLVYAACIWSRGGPAAREHFSTE